MAGTSGSSDGFFNNGVTSPCFMDSGTCPVVRDKFITLAMVVNKVVRCCIRSQDGQWSSLHDLVGDRITALCTSSALTVENVENLASVRHTSAGISDCGKLSRIFFILLAKKAHFYPKMPQGVTIPGIWPSL